MKHYFNNNMVLSMSHLEQFRADTRIWLEENCPAEMREPINSFEDHCWGGRQWQFSSDAQRIWLDRMVEKAGQTPPGRPHAAALGLELTQEKFLPRAML